MGRIKNIKLKEPSTSVQFTTRNSEMEEAQRARIELEKERNINVYNSSSMGSGK